MIKQKPVYWDIDEFENLLTKIKPMSEFLKIGDVYQKPDFLIRHENLQQDFDIFIKTMGISDEQIPLPTKNKTIDMELFKKAMQCKEAQQLAKDKHALDYEMFGYEK